MIAGPGRSGLLPPHRVQTRHFIARRSWMQDPAERVIARAASARTCLSCLYRLGLDEARRPAAIDDLPMLRSVSTGWGVWIATVWQTLDGG